MESRLKTSLPRRPPKYFPSPRNQDNAESQLVCAVSMRPGPFLPLNPKGADSILPKLPRDLWLKIPKEHSVTSTRKYVGRLESVSNSTLECSLWEVPSGIELISLIEPGNGVEIADELSPGVQIEVWTWEECDLVGVVTEQIHVRKRTS